ncbi:MAG: DUF1501 domain-containing protein [Planctomycetota bacterium]|nr:DUF1501 domain-containing protein [Planctomycetota bacterium]
MNPLEQYQLEMTRRQLLSQGSKFIGAAALTSLLAQDGALAGDAIAGAEGARGIPGLPHFAPKAKRVIYLFMAGGPSHIDTFDYKPDLRKIHGKELPESIRQGQRLSTMTSGQKSFPCVAPMFEFKRQGKHGTWVSEILPKVAGIVDDITVIKSLHTEAINHDPAITFINTGVQQPGKASLGSWISYGLGSPNKDLPSYVVMISRGPGQKQALYSRLWGSGFLPSKHQGVKMRSSSDPVLYLKDPDGIDRKMRRRMLDRLAKINEEQFGQFGDPETRTRIAQYELAFRMQASVPGLMDLSDEPEDTYKLYGPDSKKPGTFARNCVLARRMAERGVPFIQLFQRGWDQHGSLPKLIRGQCQSIDHAAAGLVQDLKQRGMLDDTLVIWGGEFGRTIYSQGKLTKNNHGRDHHGRCFTMWMAGAGIKKGFEYGKTDDHCYNIVENPQPIRNLNATILHLLGVDHNRFTYRHQGLDQKITGVEESHVIKDILA